MKPNLFIVIVAFLLIADHCKASLIEIHRRGGGADTWTNHAYKDLGQPLFVELCVFVVITTVAVMFELGHHHLHHFLEHKVSEF